MIHRILPAIFLLGAVSCTIEPGQPMVTDADAPPAVSQSRADANFRAVVARVEPVAESECRRRTEGMNCDFRIVIDNSDPDAPPNAYQTLDRSGRPIIGFTPSLIADARNRDELAFVLGHEAAHHIKNHIGQTQGTALGGAIAGAVLAGVLGLDPTAGELVTNIGGTIGARAYSKEFELEADALGTIIAARAGYSPTRGAQFFNRIPDPGDVFLGTHPPNAERIATVQRVAAGL